MDKVMTRIPLLLLTMIIVAGLTIAIGAVTTQTAYGSVTGGQSVAILSDAHITKDPKIKDLTYNAAPQELLIAGEAEDGEVWYANGEDNISPPVGGWGPEIPKKTDAGTYYVWYMAVNAEHISTTAPKCLTPVIKKKDLTITVYDQYYVYNGYQQGESDPAYVDAAMISTKVDVDGLVEPDNLTFIELDGEETEPGEYPGRIEITAYAIGEATDNYNITTVAGKLTIDIDSITPADDTADNAPVGPKIPCVKAAKIKTVGNFKKNEMTIKFPAKAAVTNYRIQYRLEGQSNWVSGWSAGTNKFVIGNMEKYSLSEIRIAAFVKQKKGNWKRSEWSKTAYRYMNSVKVNVVKAGKKKITVTWKKDANCSGYQVQWSLKKNMSKAKTVTVKGKSKTKYTIKKLKKGKKYYVKVRPIKKQSSKKYLGILSKARKAKVR